MTKRNSPKVKIVKGKVNKTKIGLTTALTRPNTAAPTTAEEKLTTANPGTIKAVTIKEIAVASQVKINCNILFDT